MEMTRRILSAAAVCFFFTIQAAGLPRLQDIIEVENFIFLDVVDGDPLPLPVSEAKRYLADEAQWLVRGAVYGFHFVYSPGDRKRNIPEEFILEPKEGFVRSTQFETPRFRDGDDRLWGYFAYRLEDYEVRRYQSWYSNIVAESQGTGKARLILGPEGRIDAHKDAVKEALHAYFRTVSPNKPKRIEGETAIAAMPVCGIDGGSYVSTLRVRIRTKDITAYDSY